ncbi:unnamed protein product [Mesocestoides corti]|uniref:Uncharacterized protein n=1 Tax=Mesocestoides corti TaxID=53468 RepID=A0A0R3URL6_MESCO|nr:unnamed protein product [Mesocestoides corti]
MPILADQSSTLEKAATEAPLGKYVIFCSAFLVIVLLLQNHRFLPIVHEN